MPVNHNHPDIASPVSRLSLAVSVARGDANAASPTSYAPVGSCFTFAEDGCFASGMNASCAYGMALCAASDD